MTSPFAPDTLRALERPLHKHLAVMAGGALLACGFTLGWDWGLAAAIGFLAGMLYYRLLAFQIRRQMLLAKPARLLPVLISLFVRQVVCLAAVGVCYMFLGAAWWACVAAIGVARHWVLVLAFSRHNRLLVTGASSS